MRWTTEEARVVSWAEFEAAAPSIAASGRRLFYRTETGQALLATVRGEGLPRVHPIFVAITGDRLVAFILPSPKATDLAIDGRYVLHAHQDPAAPHEFSVRGWAKAIDDPAIRSEIGAAWYFEVDDRNSLFEFSIEHAILGERAGPDDWPPRYSSWRSPRLTETG